ncbi:Tripartite tricarboxylate transporter family receptor [Pigmentiphaga humi]|uniref:Tripartite tricarboxylate transporter family receptor n=1 Tax=Pigmentiphaga humi TaxID=2478468 RepID=A0A3P4B0A0_9BURK|nr:tripartite tricarboxylate transporter substrate binding protein [Pigmentiphaga humi]VCU69088.1 Tripartite tricarboxylate transporter family receptor [Pigmentiphaga humi]
MRMHSLAWALTTLGMFNAIPAAQAADTYPNRPIRLVVPFEPGGSTDLTARIVAQALGDKLGQSVIVENKGGAGGNIGTAAVVEAKPDGYTLVWANVAPVAINTHLYAKMSYDPDKDLAPIGLATVFPNVLVVKSSFPASTLQEFVSQSKTRFDKLTYGSAGNGSSTHLAAEWLNTELGTSWLHVPYKGGGPALMAVVGGQVDMYFSSVPAAIPYLKNGTLKALGVTSKGRTETLPDVQPISSANLPDYEALNWNGLMAPAATPAAILDKLNAELRSVLESPDVRQRMLAQGADPSPMTRQEFADYIRSESAKWGKIVKTAKAQIQ